MNPTSKNPCKFGPGTVVIGKWHRRKYVLMKELGNGANGIVYLANDGTRETALKISANGMSITSEVNVLKSFAKVQGSALGPCLLDVDDWERPDGLVCFYVMEYIKGPGLIDFINHKGRDWVQVLMVQLLNDLEKLHQNGWVFGDLKPENLIVTGPPPRIRCIDVGGTTLKGRAIKEYTEFYDRGYWGMGSRKAEPPYDLFALAMVMITTAYPDRFNKTEAGIKQLLSAIRQKKELTLYEPVLLKAIQGHYATAGQMRNDLIDTMKKPAMPGRNLYSQTSQPQQVRKAAGSHSAQVIGTGQIKPNLSTHMTRQSRYARKNRPKQNTGQSKQQQASRTGGMRETFYIVSVMAILYIVYIVVQLV